RLHHLISRTTPATRAGRGFPSSGPPPPVTPEVEESVDDTAPAQPVRGRGAGHAARRGTHDRTRHATLADAHGACGGVARVAEHGLVRHRLPPDRVAGEPSPRRAGAGHHRRPYTEGAPDAPGGAVHRPLCDPLRTPLHPLQPV